MSNLDFHVSNLEDITLDRFSAAAYACMFAGFKDIGLGGFPCGADYDLYGEFVEAKDSPDGKWHRVSLVSLRNYCGSLEMLVTDRNGLFLTYTKIDGGSTEEVIRRMYKLFLDCKPFIDVECGHSFAKNEIDESLCKLLVDKIKAFKEAAVDLADRVKTVKQEVQA